MLAACDTGRIACMSALLIVSCDSGMRRGELLGLRWTDLALDRGIASLALTKNGSTRQVPLTIRSIKTLHALRVDASTSDDRAFPISAGSFEKVRSRVWR